ncbi:MAG: riboflavin synthase [Bryobacterales bacterium]|nr:riboflavin synthase [Bryobacterales bacterium]
MFTGIIEELGTVEAIESRAAGARFRFGCTALNDLTVGASVAVNGVCLTALEPSTRGFTADLAPETLRRSNLGDLRVGSRVNLERPLTPTSRLSGHIVQGHVDGAGQLIALDPLGDDNWWLRVRIPPELDRYLVFKGSIALDGISLTVASIEGGELAVTIIPHTYRQTNLCTRRPGERINIECDILAKHVEKLLGRIEAGTGLTLDKLRGAGFA